MKIIVAEYEVLLEIEDKLIEARRLIDQLKKDEQPHIIATRGIALMENLKTVIGMLKPDRLN